MKPSRSYRSEVQVLNLLPYKSDISSVAQSCLTLCDPMDYTIPGFPVHHQLPELAETHVHWIGDTVQPSHPLLSPFSSCLQSFPASVFSNESALHIRWPKYWSVSFSISLAMNIQDQFLLDGLVGSPCSPRDSQESSPTPQFKSISSSALSLLYSPTLTFIHDY